MVCLGFEPGAAGWKARTNPLSFGGTPRFVYFYLIMKAECSAKTIKYILVPLVQSNSFDPS